jgi:hypothetical protein
MKAKIIHAFFFWQIQIFMKKLEKNLVGIFLQRL